MKLDRRHMAASLVMLVGSILYNVWVFSGPSRTGARTDVGASSEPLSPGDAGVTAKGPLDPSQVHTLPDVALDRIPEWPRNPFQNLRERPVEVAVQEPEPPPPPPPAPDPVIGSILYSSDRRAAMVDGHIVRIGDVLAAGKVVDILPKAIVLETEEGRRTIDMKPASTGSPAK